MTFLGDKFRDNMYMHPERKLGELELELRQTGKMISALKLDSLLNVDTVAPGNDDVLTYEAVSGKWKPKPPTGGGANSSSPIYLVELSKWGIKNNGTSAVATTKGLNDAMLWAAQNGYMEVVLPKGTYLIDKDSQIRPQSFQVLNLNGSTLQKETNGYTGYSVISFRDNQVYSRVTNGIIKGDRLTHDFSSGGSHEGGYGIEVGNFSPPANGGNNCRFIFIDKLEIFDFTGDSITINSSFGQISPVPTALASSWEQGAISVTDGSLVTTTSKIRSKLQFDMTQPAIVKYGYFGLYGNGYGGLGSDITCDYYDVIFYNASNTFVASSTNVQFFDEVEVPTGATYAKVVLHQSTVPLAANCLINVRVPSFAQYVYIKKCNLHHNRRQGVSVCGGKNVHITGNVIHHISGADPQSGIDIEDGYDLNQMIYINNNMFYKNEKYNIIVVNGKNIYINGNTLLPPVNSGYVSLAVNGGADKVVVTGNTIRHNKVSLSGETIFANNYVYGAQVVTNGAYATRQIKLVGCTFHNCKYVSDTPFPYVVTVDDCSFLNDADKTNSLSTVLQWTIEVKQEPQTFVNCTFQGQDVNYLTYVASLATFKQGWVFQNCRFKNTKTPSLFAGKYINCEFTELTTSLGVSRNNDGTNSLELVNCKFVSTDANNSMLTVSSLKNFIMKDCAVEKTSGYILTVQNVNDEVIIVDNAFKQTNDALPRALVTLEASFTGSLVNIKDNYFKATNNSQVAINDLTTNTPVVVIQNNILKKTTISSSSTLKLNNIVNGVLQ